MDEGKEELTDEQAALLKDLSGDLSKISDERLMELITKLRSGELLDESDYSPPAEGPNDVGL